MDPFYSLTLEFLFKFHTEIKKGFRLKAYSLHCYDTTHVYDIIVFIYFVSTYYLKDHLRPKPINTHTV